MSTLPPLRISEICDVELSMIGLAACPGKADLSLSGPSGYVRRDLQADLMAVHDWGAEAVITLLPDEEMAELGVLGLGATVRQLGMSWLHLPINDGGAPSPGWDRDWVAGGKQIHSALDRGGRVLVHCEAGRGRSGTVAARILMDRGASAQGAINAVRTVLPGAIDGPDQLAYLMAR